MAPAAAAESDERVYRVLEPFSFDHNGRTYVMRKGDIVSTDHPSYGGGARANLFEEVTAAAAREHQQMRTQVSAVETATAAPGEHRRMEIDASIPDPHPQPPAPPTPPPAPPTPAPTGDAEPTTTAVETADAPPAKTGRGTRVLKDQPQA